ncbi:hypothetical protein N7488_004480 [Penicillium malachiteum]|nr:hypothetical protein N7488_004480 [Penicillium malachiteum]
MGSVQDDKLPFALNKYYREQDKSGSACSFGGSASTKATTAATGICSAQMKEAGTAGTGTVTSETTGTGVSSTKLTSTSSGSIAATVHASVVFASLQVCLYIATAALIGMGMILL